MKKIFRSVAALAVVMFAGCTTDMTNDNFAPIAGKTTITLGLTESRTHLGELVEGSRKVYWSNGDKVSINGVTSGEAAISSENAGVASFEFDGVLSYPYSILYPAEFYKDASTVTLPALQKAATNSFATNSAPMAAYKASEEENTIALKHLAAVIRLQVKLPTESTHTHIINKVEFRGKKGEQVSGDFVIDYTNATLAPTSTADADKVVATEIKRTFSAESATDIFVVVPAQEYSEGFSMRIIDDAGHYMDLNSGAVTLEKGQILAMPVVEFAPTGTLIDIEITSAAELVAFAKAYNDGDYYQVEPLVVHIANDIEFDEATNAEWVPIGNKFGADNKLGLEEGTTNYFHGYFEGNGHSIKNWVSSRPLFAYVGGEAVVKSLNIDASCTLTANFADNVEYAAAYVGYLRGELIDCHCNANITVSGTWSTAAIGALAGRIVVGNVENCTMNGDITLDTTFLVEEAIYVGGLAGRISNADGTIQNSHFTGNMLMQGGTLNASKNNKQYLYLGGIVGQTSGTITNCSTTASKQILSTVMNVENDSEVLVDNSIYYFIQGGIAGVVSETGVVEECTNNATSKVQYQRNSDATHQLFLGGVAGKVLSNGIVKNCTNNGTVQSRTACKNLYIGGITGGALEDSTIENCVNNGDTNARTSGTGSRSGRYTNIGGVIGECLTSKVSKVSNTGSIEVSSSENAVYVTTHLGGIFGELGASIDGKNEITNGGPVAITANGATHFYSAVGGVCGCLTSENETPSLSNVSNTGTVKNICANIQYHPYLGGVVGLMGSDCSISNVSNSGAITFGKEDVGHIDACIGGIVGSAINLTGTLIAPVYTYVKADISNAVNTGSITISGLSTKSVKNIATGGIIGVLKGDKGATISACRNSGNISASVFNNTYKDNAYDSILGDLVVTDGAFTSYTATGCATLGGIAGAALGSEGSPVVITGCTNEAANQASSRGYNGGIVGYARLATISGNTTTATLIKSANTETRVAGVAAFLENSSVASCSVVGTTLDGVKSGHIGGIVSGINKDSSITGSTFNGGTITNSGSTTYTVAAIAARSEVGATITDCGAKGKIGFNKVLADITLDDFCGDTNATITGSYILE